LALGLSTDAKGQQARLATGSHCGNQVTPDVAGPHDPLGFNLLATPGSEDQSDPVDPFDGPCSGPTCSKAPAAPMPAPMAPPSAPTSVSWAFWAEEVPTSPIPLGPPRTDEAAVRPAHLAAGVFHPPR
jgi:hypothetical protein